MSKRTCKDISGGPAKVQNTVQRMVLLHPEQVSNQELNQRTPRADKWIANHQPLEQECWFGTGTSNLVDWKALTRAMNSMPKAQQRWVSKAAVHFLPDGQNMRRWKQRSHNTCPRCHTVPETHDHIFRCQAPETKQRWKNSLTQLKSWMKETKMFPTIQCKILEGLNNWQNTRETNTINTASEASKEQSWLGWNLALDGVISKKWQEEQAAVWKAFKLRKSSQRWTTALIQRLVDMAWDMWHHRNEVLHNSSYNKEHLLEANINQELQDLYYLGPQLLPQDAFHLWKRTAAQLKQLPSLYKHQWVETVKLAQARPEQALEGPYCLECQGMRQFFHWM